MKSYLCDVAAAHYNVNAACEAADSAVRGRYRANEQAVDRIYFSAVGVGTTDQYRTA